MSRAVTFASNAAGADLVCSVLELVGLSPSCRRAVILRIRFFCERSAWRSTVQKDILPSFEVIQSRSRTANLFPVFLFRTIAVLVRPHCQKTPTSQPFVAIPMPLSYHARAPQDLGDRRPLRWRRSCIHGLRKTYLPDVRSSAIAERTRVRDL